MTNDPKRTRLSQFIPVYPGLSRFIPVFFFRLPPYNATAAPPPPRPSLCPSPTPEPPPQKRVGEGPRFHRGEPQNSALTFLGGGVPNIPGESGLNRFGSKRAIFGSKRSHFRTTLGKISEGATTPKRDKNSVPSSGGGPENPDKSELSRERPFWGQNEPVFGSERAVFGSERAFFEGQNEPVLGVRTSLFWGQSEHFLRVGTSRFLGSERAGFWVKTSIF